MVAFMRQLHGVVVKLMTCLALALGLPEDAFLKEMCIEDDDNGSALSFNYFPSVEGKEVKPEAGVAAAGHALQRAAAKRPAQAARQRRVWKLCGSSGDPIPATRPVARVPPRGAAHAQRNHVVGGVAHHPLERAVVGGDA
jgi:hypothetical protein